MKSQLINWKIIIEKEFYRNKLNFGYREILEDRIINILYDLSNYKKEDIECLIKSKLFKIFKKK